MISIPDMVLKWKKHYLQIWNVMKTFADISEDGSKNFYLKWSPFKKTLIILFVRIVWSRQM